MRIFRIILGFHLEVFMKKIIKISIIILISCLILIFIKNQYSFLLLRNSTYGMPHLIKKGEIRNLYIGSSMFRQGIDINVLEQTPDPDNYILAYNGNQPAMEYYELKYLLDNNVRIQNVYVDMYVYTAWNAPELSDERILMEFGIADKKNIWTLINSDTFKNNPESFWRFWVSSNNELIITWPICSPIINSQFYNGGTLTKTASASSQELIDSAAITISGTMNPIQEHYIKELISLCQNHDINICFVETPKYQTAANDPSYLSAMQQYTQLLIDAQASCILCENTWQFIGEPQQIFHYSFDNSDESYYMDTLHLSSHGRADFTMSLLNQTLPNDRTTNESYSVFGSSDKKNFSPCREQATEFNQNLNFRKYRNLYSLVH